MSCSHHYYQQAGLGDDAFTLDASTVTFGAGCLKEAGDHARAQGMKRVALFTDKALPECWTQQTLVGP